MVLTDGYAEWRTRYRRRRTGNELAVARGTAMEAGRYV
jgi:hypothetical protein